VHGGSRRGTDRQEAKTPGLRHPEFHFLAAEDKAEVFQSTLRVNLLPKRQVESEDFSEYSLYFSIRRPLAEAGLHDRVYHGASPSQI
jgi:hypothetical protein